VRAEHIREVPRGTPYRVDWVDGCCLLVRCAAAAAVGGFDEDYFLYYEDADLCQRVGHAGWSILVAPGAEVGHDKSAVPAAHYFHYMTRNRYRFWRKNFGI
ncbi:MAG: hypothetical protein GWN71_18220, partial [Gammaproteobacteria bacterium]|nr:hypothetical protein [Gemmatimonadota bacterium]NIU75438.1 hypothetical protein [Gammaproteobacteria bacterium]